jgi:hypothetical protein
LLGEGLVGRAGRRAPHAERAVILPAVQSLRRACSEGACWESGEACAERSQAGSPSHSGGNGGFGGVRVDWKFLLIGLVRIWWDLSVQFHGG